MKTIFFQNGVYVCSNETFNYKNDYTKAITDVSIIICDDCYQLHSKLLYGGRVEVEFPSYERGGCTLTIDGVEIKSLDYQYLNGTCAVIGVKNELTMQKVTAYLNQIEQLGIETFLENYKTALENSKADIMVLCEKYESLLKEDESDSGSANTYKAFLDRARACLTIFTIILFSLACNMKTGLDNHVYEDTYNEVLAEHDVDND